MTVSSRSPDVGPEGEHDEECPHEEVAEAGDWVDAEEAENAGEKVEEHEGAEEGGGRAGSLEHILGLILLNILQEQLVYLLGAEGRVAITGSHGFLHFTRTDFMPFADSQKKAKFIRYSCIQFTAQYIYNCLIRYF